MKITKVSKMTGREHTREIAISGEQLARWKGGAYIQDVCPHLSPDDREFLISGVTPEEWAAAFGVDPTCEHGVERLSCYRCYQIDIIEASRR
jgi:hypothetical protein